MGLQINPLSRGKILGSLLALVVAGCAGDGSEGASTPYATTQTFSGGGVDFNSDSGSQSNSSATTTSQPGTASSAKTKQFDCPSEMPPSIVTDEGSQAVRDEIDRRVVDIACQMQNLDRNLTNWRREQPASDSVRATLYPTAVEVDLFEQHSKWLRALVAIGDLANIYPDSIQPSELPSIISAARSAQDCLDSGSWCYRTD